MEKKQRRRIIKSDSVADKVWAAAGNASPDKKKKNLEERPKGKNVPSSGKER